MGVLGLWQLLAPVGQPVTLESLENKIFAVDISIWLNQALKGYRDSRGGSVPNAHLLSLYSRLCKLLFYKIRPIIVFDGGFPELKKQTIINRQQRRAAVKQNTRNVGLKILTNYLASQQLGKTVDTSSHNKILFKRKEKPREEIFKLPPLPENSLSLSDSYESNEDQGRKFTNFTKEDIKYLNQIDIESEDFNALPPDVKQEILSTLKESRKHRSWDQYDKLPEEYNDFSKYQMQSLLKKRKLQSKLEQVQKDLRQINSSAYVSQYTNDHVIGETNKIMSDDTSYYVLLKKIIEHKGDSDKSFDDVKPSTSVMADTKSAFIRDVENIDLDEDCDFNDSLVDTKETLSHPMSTKIKLENNFSDEEYDIDNPPLTSAIKDKPVQTPKQNIEAKNDKNLMQASREAIEAKCKTNETSICNTQIEVEYMENVDHKEPQRNKINTETKLSTPEKEFKIDKNINEFITISDINEVVLCNDISVLSNANLSNNITVINKDKHKENNFVHKTESCMYSETKFSGKQCESSVRNESIEQDGILAGTPEISSDRFSSLSKQSCDSQMVPEENLHEKNLQLQENLYKKKLEFQENLDTAVAIQESDLAMIMDENLCKENLEFQENLDTTIAIQEAEQAMIMDENLRKENLELQENLDTAAAILEAEQVKQDRQSNTVQDHMIEECKELLQLFGIPYIVSPLEAEAQCAFYDIVDFTHGTITDDSDVWLFGGKRVFKNFFTQNKFVESYKDKEIFTHFGLSRKKLINFALLTGSDYTEGIEGVGPVTAMEIISEFPGEGIDALQKFKDWWDDSNKHASPPENKVRAKLLKLVLARNFPDMKVFDAYLNPEVDSSMEKFTWGRPDLDALRDYAKERFGWNQSKVDNDLLPVLKKLNDRDRQMHLDSFFTVTLQKEKNLFPSKRIMSALKKITSPEKLGTENNKESNAIKRKSKVSGKKVIPKKIVRKVSSRRGRGRNRNVKSEGPALSESSSDSES